MESRMQNIKLWPSFGQKLANFWAKNGTQNTNVAISWPFYVQLWKTWALKSSTSLEESDSQKKFELAHSLFNLQSNYQKMGVAGCS